MRRALIAGVAIVVVAVVALVVVLAVNSARNSEQPPALQASAGVYRLTPTPPGVPEIPERVSTAAGTRYLTYGAVIDPLAARCACRAGTVSVPAQQAPRT
ncbi:MAG: hypothetical protein J2P28_03960 [Actinobacteria bacterium]|nr:hypothetical protein [Actinomycetota bacterium]